MELDWIFGPLEAALLYVVPSDRTAKQEAP